jgi:hypothetical protein
MIPSRNLQLVMPFADDTRIYTVRKHKRRVLYKLQRGLNAVH